MLLTGLLALSLVSITALASTFTFRGSNGTTVRIQGGWCSPGVAASSVLLVFPGGGYRSLAKHEGAPICQLLQSQGGFCCYVVRYRTPPPHRHSPLWEGEAAIEYAHQHHPWSRICLVGFSAGGHAVAVLARDGAFPVQAVVMAYPVVSFQRELTHLGSTQSLLGYKGSKNPVLLDHYSLERDLPECFPKTFIFHSRDDTIVSVANTEIFVEALQRVGVPHEVHLFPSGRHGYGIPGKHLKGAVRSWPARMLRWLKKEGL